MGRIVRWKYIEVPDNYWESSANVEWVIVNG
jgi:hypothetical protein